VKDWRLARRLRNVEYSEYAGALSEMTAELLVENADMIRPGLEVGVGRRRGARLLRRRDVDRGLVATRLRRRTPHLPPARPKRTGEGAPRHQVGVASIMTEYLHSGENGGRSAIRDALAAALDAPTTAAELSDSTMRS